MSSLDNDLTLQYQFSKVQVSVNGDVVWTKGKPAMLPVEIEVTRGSASDKMELHVQASARAARA